MNRITEAFLLDFCERQNRAFSEAAWLAATFATKKELAAVAFYLAGTNWFGHKEALGKVAYKLYETGDLNLTALLREVEFDPSRFKNLLTHRLEHESVT